MKKCDLVMKGGITSGVVYPAAVSELAKEFRFASIGGTSAGAIAASLTAAAECRRQNGGGDAGFRELSELPAWLGTTEGGRSRLLSLFQPVRETRALFAVAMRFLESGSRARTLLELLRRFSLWALFCGALGAVPVFFAAASAVTLWRESRTIAAGALVAAVLAGVGTLLAACLAAVLQAARDAFRLLPRNAFGICSGRTSAGSGEGLTDWLSRRIDEVAGVEGPLTFGDLWRAGGGSDEARSINLEMMTTSLTHGRPWRLPLENRNLWFAPGEMRTLFPERVVDWMVAHSPGARRLRSADGDELHRMPEAAELPVIVATRMSLSFPLLLSAVPLWSVDFARRGRHAPERCWFSDGGITSNFPVHFFDAPLPRWPTFAINLAGRTPRYHRDDQRIYVPQSNRGGIQEWWTPFSTLGGFLGAIVNTMQNWRDNMLLHLPGQRDRIAHVLLAPGEGGLNLTMNAETIADVANRGAEAAADFRRRFGDAPPPGEQLTWANHKWVRFLTFMGALEPALLSWERAFDHTEDPPAYRDLTAGPLPSYKLRPAEREAARRASLAFLAHISTTFGTRPFTTPKRRPRGSVALRVMPKE